MNASELHRKLVYCGYSDLSDYLKDSQLNRYLYEMLLDMKNSGELDNPILTIFNELYYQCTRVQFDSRPGDDLKRRYIGECTYWLHSAHDARLVLSIVWTFYALRGVYSFEEECFYKNITPLIREGKNDLCDRIYSEMNNLAIPFPRDFKPMPVPAADIPSYVIRAEVNPITILTKMFKVEDTPSNPWEAITNGFTHKAVERYVYLYSNPADQLTILDRIIEACDSKRHENYLHELHKKIASEGKKEGIKRVAASSNVDELKVQLKQREEEYENQLTATKKQYDELIDSIKATYDKEIGSLRSQIEQLKSTQEAAESKADAVPEPQKPSLTVEAMIDHVKQKFSKQGAEDFRDMYWHFVGCEQLGFDQHLARLMDGIRDAIMERDKTQLKIDIDHVDNFNNNPQAVNNNHYNSEKTNDNGNKD